MRFDAKGVPIGGEDVSSSVYVRSDGTRVVEMYDTKCYASTQYKRDCTVVDVSDSGFGLTSHRVDNVDGTYDETVTDQAGNIRAVRMLPNGSRICEESRVDGSSYFAELTPSGMVYLVDKLSDGKIIKKQYGSDGSYGFSITCTNGDYCSRNVDSKGNVSDYSSNPDLQMPEYESFDYEAFVADFPSTCAAMQNDRVIENVPAHVFREAEQYVAAI